ncbi:MAG: DUF4255 domain-containing protein [Rhodocyclaceae bacterium]|nr:DUF4255 domain-containing protein [Rhodocyclaceae bacterium]
MPVGLSSLSQVCRNLAQQVSAGINAVDRSRVDVLLGTPAAAAPADTDTNHRLNLFFFRFEPSGFDADLLPGETWLLRMHCLATPFCVDENPIPAGENDLRVIGEVLRHFHEAPVFDLDVDGDSFRIQVIFLTLGLDQLNQLWSTQGDTPYRPSALFEVSLAPVIPRTPAVPAPLAGALGLGIRARMDAGTEGIVAGPPEVPAQAPDTSREDWLPALCLVDGTRCLQSAAFAVGSPELATFAPQAWVAGDPGSQVSLRWERWDAATGWQADPPSPPFPVLDAAIDPDDVAGATLQAVTLPFVGQPGQMVLYAERSVQRFDGVTLTLRSNPVLVSLYTVAP